MKLVQLRQRGAAMIVALISLAVVSVFAVTVLTTVLQEAKGVDIDFDRAQALKSADGLVDVGEFALVEAITNGTTMSSPTPINPWLVLSGAQTIGNIEGTWEVSHSVRRENGVDVPVPNSTEVDPISGITRFIEYYDAVSTVRHRTSKVHVRRQLRVSKIPVFQFLAFYNSDLEMMPGPTIQLNGRVHTNGDLYMAPGSTLTIDSTYLRAAGALLRKRKDSNSNPSGVIKVRDAAPGGPLDILWSKANLASMGIGSLNGLDSQFNGWDENGDFIFDQPGEMDPFKVEVMEIFNGSIQTGEHGLMSFRLPVWESLLPYETFAGGDLIAGLLPGQYTAVPPGTGTHRRGGLHESASLVLLDSQVFDTDGNNITALMPAGFRTTQNIWDQREGKWSITTRLNLARLWDMDGNPATLDPSPYRPTNGLIYATRTEASAANPNGITLSAGSQINIPDIWNSSNYGGTSPKYAGAPPAGAYAFGAAENMGLTVVSNCPIYVHGDYNTDNKKPCSVITDAISLLSNAWDFSKSPGGQVHATSTTYNVAMITGSRPTQFGFYNGGFENLPRFHENWTNKGATIVGSFVCGWDSRIATSQWIYGGSYYTAPLRYWSYDTSFDSGSLPPFTPMVVETERLAYDMSL